MTEKSNEAYELFVRQTWLSRNRIPVLLGGMPGAILNWYNQVGKEVGQVGTGIQGVTEIANATMADDVIWAARWMRCTAEMHGECRANEYDGVCWIDRDDYTPELKQAAEPSGRASWHPGFKVR